MSLLFSRTRKIERTADCLRKQTPFGEVVDLIGLLGVAVDNSMLDKGALVHLKADKRAITFTKAKREHDSVRSIALVRFATLHGLAHIALNHNVTEEVIGSDKSDTEFPYAWDFGDKITHRFPEGGQSIEEEWAADQFAASFLVPRAKLLKYVRQDEIRQLHLMFHEASDLGDDHKKYLVTAEEYRVTRMSDKKLLRRQTQDLITGLYESSDTWLHNAALNFYVPSAAVQHQMLQPDYPYQGIISAT